MDGVNENSNGHEAHSVIDMPAGDARREQEAVNKDFLDQEAETRAAHMHATAFDPSKIALEPEIVSHFTMAGMLEVSDADPAYHYYWCGTGGHGFMITYLTSIRLKNNHTGSLEAVWEIVKGDMKESWENRDVTGVRRVGDTILLRSRKDRYLMYRRWERNQRIAAQSPEASAAALLDAARGAPKNITVSVNNPMADPRIRAAARRYAARGVALDRFVGLLREGKIPGLSVNAAAGYAR